jgi:oxygen-dependent protoporphyrinogen oxidase
MPQYHLGHLELMEQIDERARALPTFALCGNAYRGVGVPQCVQSGEAAAKELLESLSVKLTLDRSSTS